MGSVILYGSQYGSARRYAEAFSRMTGFPAASFGDGADLSACERVIYFGGLYAGGVKGLRQTAAALPPDTAMVIVTVGLADVSDPENIRSIRRSLRRQVPQRVWDRAILFHLRGGIDYSRLSLRHRAMMALLYRQVSRLPAEKQTAETRGILETYGKAVDFFDSGALLPILEAVR